MIHIGRQIAQDKLIEDIMKTIAQQIRSNWEDQSEILYDILLYGTKGVINMGDKEIEKGLEEKFNKPHTIIYG